MRQFGLIGKQLSHSFSAAYFMRKFTTLGLKASYANFECESIADVSDLLSKTTCEGFNVTIPYKTAIIPLLDELDEVAEAIGAVNTIKKVNGKWIGYNTDVFGFRQMIKPFFKSHHERVVIFGTGGASKAVAHVFEALGANVIFVSRNPKASNHYAYEAVNDIMLNACKVLVNTTPVGTFPNVNDTLPIPFEVLTDKHLAIDLIYNPETTLFLKKAKQYGAWTVNGETMLHQQAEKAWTIWNA